MHHINKTLLAAAVTLGLTGSPAMAVDLQLRNVDPPGVGFNDPTPAAPVGGNAGTTVGQQRLIAYRKALELWGKTLAGDVTVVVRGSFAGLTCTSGGGTLAQAGALQIWSDFPNASLAGHWYGAALANNIAGADLDGLPLTDPDGDEIQANFNGNVGKPDCIAGPGWYYGLDSNPPTGAIDFLDTFMHEVAHGLGFQNFANEATGSLIAGLPDVYMANTLDLTLGKIWNDPTFYPTPANIVASSIRNGQIVWSGPKVSANAGSVLGDFEGLGISGTVDIPELFFGTASFGPPATPANFSGEIVQGLDGVIAGVAGARIDDGCEPLTIDATGKIVLMYRGVCGFTVKVKNAQNAGAKAAIIANDGASSTRLYEFGPGGADSTITIPSIGIGFADGNTIVAGSPGAVAAFYVDPTRLAGTTDGYVRLYAPRTVTLGSSISHYDITASPNLLMEPAITGSLRANENLDLTPSLMADIGWKLETLKVGSCDTGVENALPNGALLNVQVEACAARARNSGQFVSCVNSVTNAAKAAGLLTGQQNARITSCTAQAR
jgi:PA domain